MASLSCWKDDNGNILGEYDLNQLLNTITYDVEILDREVK